MNRTYVFPCFFFFCLSVLSSLSVRAQDSLSAKEGRTYSTIGFQASFVSGIGISAGFNEADKYRIRVTGGFVTANNVAYYSFGIEYEVELSKHKPYRVFIGPGFGFRGESDGDPHTTVGLGTGYETSLTGNSIFENVTGGVEVYYPTYYFLTNTIWFGGGVFISYNF